MGIIKKLLNKHTLSLASNAVMPVVGMVTVGLLARNLSKPDFGNWIFFLITFTLANTFRTGFLQTSLIKFYAGAEKQRALTVAGSAWFVGFGLTVLLGLISLGAYIFYHGHPATELTIKWFAIIYFSTLPSSIAMWLLQAEEKFGRVFFLMLTSQLSFLIGIVILMFLHQTNFNIVIHVYFSCVVFTSLFAVVCGWAQFISIKNNTWACMKELIHFGKFSVGTSISSYLLRSSDTFVIKFMFADPAVVGIYYLPQRLMEVIEIPLRAFIATGLPAMSAAAQRNDKKQVTHIMKKYAGFLTITIVPVAVAAFIGADLVVALLGGQKFAGSEAANVFRIFMCFAILLPVDRFFGITLDIMNKPHLNMIKVLLMLGVNVVGDIAGVYLFHTLYAVAISSIFTFIVGVVFGYVALKKELDFSVKDIFTLGFAELRSMATNLTGKLSTKAAKAS
ncbi:hypothetical protein BH09BAC6_BH09BAC6_28670 [soil metagenome]|jgi:O-antigen/teichoic acid export membrane protein